MEKVWNSDDLLPKKFKSIMKITLLFLYWVYCMSRRIPMRKKLKLR